MSDKRKKRKFNAIRERRRLNQLREEGRLVNGEEVPSRAVPADQSQQDPNNSYSLRPAYYIDLDFTCCDCGKADVWTAEQQKWYYETAKGSLYATAIRCRDCRIRLKDLKEEQRQHMEEMKRRDADG